MSNYEKIKLTDISSAEYNPRKISEAEQLKLRNSIDTFGVVDPIIINLKNNKIIGGHQRYDTLLDKYMEDNNFFEELNLIRLGDVGWVFPDTDLKIPTEDHEKALNLALNKISGEWDTPKLADLLTELDLSGFGIELTGFDELELDELNINLGDERERESNEYGYIIPEDEPEFDESIADDVESITCPRCGYELPKNY